MEGALRDASGRPLLGGAIALVPVSRRDNPALYYTAVADSIRNFTIRGIAPGEYKLFSWDYVPSGAVYKGSKLSLQFRLPRQLQYYGLTALKNKVAATPERVYELWFGR